MGTLTLLALSFDISLDALLEKGIAVFFAVFLLVVFGKRLKALESATQQQTLMFRDCIIWLGELIRHDKKISPPTSPGMHQHMRHEDIKRHPENGSTPTPKPPPAPPNPSPSGGKR